MAKVKKYKNLDEVLNTVAEPSMNYYIQYVHTGMSYATFETQSNQVPFNQQEWSKALQLSERTFQRYKKDNKRFEGIYAEKILEIVLLFAKGKEVFGEAKLFHEWLNTPCVALGNEKPSFYIDNTFGIQAIKQELGRLEHGVFS